MREIIIHIYLMIGAYEDGKTKKIKSWYLWLGGVLGVLLKGTDFLLANHNLYEWILSLLPGILFLICNKVRKEMIGNGDGLVLLVLGCCYPGVELWFVFGGSMILMSLYVLFMLLAGKVDKKTQIPYLPFLWLADLIIRGVSYVS